MKYIIDTDPGTDDILALTVALNKLDDILLISTMGGNVALDQTAQNALDIVHWCNKDVPVCKGNDMTLLGFKFASETWLMGNNGVCDYKFPRSPKELIEDDVVDTIYKKIVDCGEKVTIIALAPLTNIAKLLIKYPAIKSRIYEILIMGGSIHKRGNVTELAEYNFHSDADAAKFVLESKVNIRLFPMEIGHTADFNEEEIEKLREGGGRTGKMLHYIISSAWKNINKKENAHKLIEGGLALHDIFVVLYAIEPTLFKFKKADVKVFTNHQSYEQLGSIHINFEDIEDSNIEFAYYFEKEQAQKLLFEIIDNCDN